MLDLKQFKSVEGNKWPKVLWSGMTKEDVIVHVGGWGTNRKTYKYNVDTDKCYFIDPLYKETKHPCYRYVISSEDGTEKFYVANSIQNSSLFVEHAEGSKQFYDIEGLTLDRFIERYNIEKIDYLIINAEGGEYLLFESLDKDWMNKTNVICVDLHKGCVSNEELHRNNILEILEYFWDDVLIYEKNDCVRALGVKYKSCCAV